MYVWDEKKGRRRFLAGCAAGAAVAASGCASYGTHERAMKTDGGGAAKFGRDAGQWIPSCCSMCGGQSGILVHVVDGVVEKIEPNHWNPNNYSNVSSDFFDGYTEEFGCSEGGSICPKGNAGIMQLYDPDRVRVPRKRTNPNKGPGEDPGWQDISWQQAIDEIAGKLRALRDAGEAHKLLWWSEDHSFVHVQNDFCKLFGSPNYSMHSNLCDVARKAFFRTAMGDDRPIADFLQSRFILLFGWNPSSALKWVYLARTLTRGIERGARLVVVDPYLSDTAAKAQQWVSIRPGTDGALALALSHVIVRDKLYDREFVQRWSVGFDRYAKFLEDKTPEWASSVTSVPTKAIEHLGRELGTIRPALVDAWSGAGQHSNGVQSGRAIALLAALVGGYDRPGTLLVPEKKGNVHVEVHPEAGAKQGLSQPRFDGLKDFPLAHKSGVYGRMWERLLDGKGPYVPKMGVCVFQNLVMSGPGSSRVAEALAKLETLVVVDTMMSETAWLADYLIPGTVYLERYDLNTHWVSWPALGLRQPVVGAAQRQTQPYPYRGGIFGQMAEYEWVAALGRRLELTTQEGIPFFSSGPLSGKPIADLTEWYEDYLSRELVKGPGITLEQLKNLPGAVWVDRKGTRYEKYAEPLSASLVASAWFDGAADQDGTLVYDRPKDEGGAPVGVVVDGRPVKGFATPSRKIEFFADGLIGKKDVRGRPVDPLPAYAPRDWQPDAQFPLYLINWKEANHTHTRTQNNAWLVEIKPHNPLVIHPDTAAKLGISEGDQVIVESLHGSVRAVARLTRRIHPEVVGSQHGFGHTQMGRIARGRGSAFGDLNKIAYDPLSGQGLHKEICVRLRRA